MSRVILCKGEDVTKEERIEGGVVAKEMLRI